MKPHKHAELIKAWADGAVIQERYSFTEWRVFDGCWQQADAYSYRIKPEPKPDVVRYGCFNINEVINTSTDMRVYEVAQRIVFPSIEQLKLTFDGETGKLKSAEVL